MALRDELEKCQWFPGEIEWAKKLAASYKHDPESHQGFWENLLLKKQTIPGYVIFVDFPKDIEESCLPKNEIAMKYSSDILNMLRGRKPPSE